MQFYVWGVACEYKFWGTFSIRSSKMFPKLQVVVKKYIVGRFLWLQWRAFWRVSRILGWASRTHSKTRAWRWSRLFWPRSLGGIRFAIKSGVGPKGPGHFHAVIGVDFGATPIINHHFLPLAEGTLQPSAALRVGIRMRTHLARWCCASRSYIPRTSPAFPSAYQ